MGFLFITLAVFAHSCFSARWQLLVCFKYFLCSVRKCSVKFENMEYVVGHMKGNLYLFYFRLEINFNFNWLFFLKKVELFVKFCIEASCGVVLLLIYAKQDSLYNILFCHLTNNHVYLKGTPWLISGYFCRCLRTIKSHFQAVLMSSLLESECYLNGPNISRSETIKTSLCKHSLF